MAFTEVTRQPVYLQIAGQLREAILEGRYAPGESLPTERELCEAFAASRASVREALRALQAQGLIASSGAPARAVVARAFDRGAREALVSVLQLQRVALPDLIELRCLLECAAMRRAAEAPDPERLSEARAEVAAMAGLDDIEAFDEADVRFHVALVRASGNEAMHLMMLALRDPVAQHLLTSLRADAEPVATLRRLAAEHAEIFAAVEAGEGDRAAGLVEHHIRSFYVSGSSTGASSA